MIILALSKPLAVALALTVRVVLYIVCVVSSPTSSTSTMTSMTGTTMTTGFTPVEEVVGSEPIQFLPSLDRQPT